MIEAIGIGHSYRGAPALRDVSLTIADGEVLGLVGPNGSGKSTLVRAIAGTLRPRAGAVLIDSRPAEAMTPRERARRIAVVVQEPAGELPMSVTEAVLVGRLPRRGWLEGGAAHLPAVRAALVEVDATHLADRDVASLSGGERQRVLVARALAQDTDHLLMDEPTNHLDTHYQHELLGLIRRLRLTTMVVLHDLNLASRYCDRIVVLDAGRVVARGTPREALRPDLVEQVYRIPTERVHASDGTPQLLFHA